MKTPSEQVIKSMLFILDNSDSDGEPVSDALQKLSFVHAEIIRDLCKKYGVELNEPLPFEVQQLSDSIREEASEVTIKKEAA